MKSNTPQFKVRLGIFITGGLLLFIAAIFIIGKQKNLFNPVFRVVTTFHNISGLQVGNNIRFAGINVGTIDDINIINDSSVKIVMSIRTEVQNFIKSDCIAGIGSEGIIGDRILTLSQGGLNASVIKEGDNIASFEPIETDAIMTSVKVSAENAEIITDQLAEIMIKINSGNGTLGKLIQDSTIAENFNQTIKNLKSSSKGLKENMEAAKSNFLLKGYFNKKKKAEEKKLKEIEKAKEEKKENDSIK